MRRITGFTIAALVFSMPAAGWAQSENDIPIGVVQPLTGDVAVSGQYVVNGARIAADKINAEGGVLGRKITLVVGDGKSTPRDAATAAQRLILRDHVPVMMGAWGSSFTLSVMPLLQENGLPMLVETSSSPKITTSGNPWVFRISPTFKMEAEGFLSKLGQFNPPIKKAAFLAVNNDFGLAGTNAFKTALASTGVAIGPMETMASDSTDFSAQLENIKASGADTLFVTTAVEQLTLIEKQSAELRLSVRIVGVGGSTEPDQLIQQAGQSANGTYLTLFFLPWFPEKAPYPELAKQFVDEWTKQGYNFGGLTEGFRGYDGITTIAAAIREAGSTEPDKIRQAFWKVKVKGLNGDIAFAPDGPKGQESGQSTPNVYIVQIKDGKVTLLQ
jgi:branched-chain amino acid transport system substrate-binding protein